MAPVDPTTWHTELDSPVGRLSVVRDAGAVTGLYFEGHSRRPDVARWGERRADGFEQLASELGEYFTGTRRRFTLPVRLDGRPFQQQVWALLAQIPHGETTTYGALSARLASRSAHPRAVGHAVGQNPVSLLVPCHRVVGATGSLTGYAGGLARKQHLLVLEGVLGEGESVVPRGPTLFAL
ncbi:methylated-DNA--[protein]-cysteine S-methyltransferase [Dermatophilaceae bacterium Soc4.6]